MNTRKLEKWLLLEQSGELSPRQARQLNRMLETSEAARTMRQQLSRLKDSVKTPAVDLAPWTVARISARLNERRRATPNLHNVLKPALALAACLIMVAGLFNFHGNRKPSTSAAVIVTAAGSDVWNDSAEEELGKLENLMVAISGNPLNIMEM